MDIKDRQQYSVIAEPLELQPLNGHSFSYGDQNSIQKVHLKAETKCKVSRPALPIHHTMVVLHCSYPAAVHRPSTGVYIYLGGHHWTWGYKPQRCVGILG